MIKWKIVKSTIDNRKLRRKAKRVYLDVRRFQRRPYKINLTGYDNYLTIMEEEKAYDFQRWIL